MLNIDLQSDKVTNKVLLSIGDELLKEAVLMEYATNVVLEDGDHASLFHRALDFISRVITRFSAWIKNGTLKLAKTHLEKLKKDEKRGYNDMYLPENDRKIYVRFWDMKVFNNVKTSIDSFHEIPITKIIEHGTVQSNYDRDVKKYFPHVENAEKTLKRIYAELKKEKAYPLSMSHHTDFDEVLKFINKTCNGTYHELQKALDSIGVVRKMEKERGHNNSNAVSEQYTHLMTLLGKCYLQEMTIVQYIAEMLTSGCELRRINAGGANGGKYDKQLVVKKPTLEFIFEKCREMMMDKEVKTRGILIGKADIDKTHHRIELVENNLTSTNSPMVVTIGCSEISRPVAEFIAKHPPTNPIMPSDLNIA